MEFDDITFAEYSQKRKKKKIISTIVFFLIVIIGLIGLGIIFCLPTNKGATAREWLEAGIDEAGIDNVYKINFIGTNEEGVFGKEYKYICFIYEIYQLEDDSETDETFDDINSDIGFYKTKEIKYVAFLWFKKNNNILVSNTEKSNYIKCLDFDIARILE